MKSNDTKWTRVDVGLNNSHLHILLTTLRKKLGAEMFEPEYLMKALSGDIIIPKFEEYNYYHVAKSKPEVILCWVRDIVDVYKKETQMLTDFSNIDINETSRIDIVVRGGHGQGVIRFKIKILYTINIVQTHENIQPIGWILYKKNNGVTLKDAIIKDFGDSNDLLTESMIFNNQHIFPPNIYVTC